MVNFFSSNRKLTHSPCHCKHSGNSSCCCQSGLLHHHLGLPYPALTFVRCPVPYTLLSYLWYNATCFLLGPRLIHLASSSKARRTKNHDKEFSFNFQWAPRGKDNRFYFVMVVLINGLISTGTLSSCIWEEYQWSKKQRILKLCHLHLCKYTIWCELHMMSLVFHK